MSGGLFDSEALVYASRTAIPIDSSVNGYTIEACFKLHNLCLADFYTNNHGGDFVPPANHCYSPVAILGMGRSQRGGITRGDIKLRASICSATRRMGLIRPPGVEENRVITNIRCSENDQDAVDAEIQSHLPSTVL